MLINAGLAMYYHQQVAFVANQVAQSCTDKLTWMGVPRAGVTAATINASGSAANLANSMLASLRLPRASSVVVASNGTTVTVNIVVTGMGVFGRASFLPTALNVTETGVAALSQDRPPAVCEIDDGPGTLPGRYSVIVPCYRAQGAAAANPAVAGGPPTTGYQYGFWLNQAFYTPGVYPNSLQF